MAEGEAGPVPVRPPVPRPRPTSEDPPQRRGAQAGSSRGAQGRGLTGVIQDLLEELLLRGEAEKDAQEGAPREALGQGDQGSAGGGPRVNGAQGSDAALRDPGAGPASVPEEQQVGFGHTLSQLTEWPHMFWP